jgi:hypothetical protein
MEGFSMVSEMENLESVWRSKKFREEIAGTYQDWLSNMCDWKVFVTLTFRDYKTPDVARALFRWWVKKNNEYAFGKRYSKKVGHSYFSYIMGLEYQKRDVVHFHVLIDSPINYSLTHELWGDRCGFAWIDGEIKQKCDVVKYVCKYVLKGGDIDIYKKKGNFYPDPQPNWWKGL